MRNIFLLWGLLFAPLFLCAQTSTLASKVVDEEGAPIFAANVFLAQHANVGAITDLNGAFQIVIPSPTLLHDTLVIAYMGYQTQRIALKGKSTLPSPIVLKEERVAIADTYIIATPSATREFAVKEYKPLNIYADPRANADVLKVVTSHPASTNTSEGAEPELRGSSADLSSVVFNNVPIYRPVRNATTDRTGSFSLLSTAIVERQHTYASNPPLSISNALAGAIDIQTQREVPAQYTSLGLSLASASLMHTQPIGESAFVQVYSNYMNSRGFLLVNPQTEDLISFGSVDGAINARKNIGRRFAVNLYAYYIDETFAAQGYTYGYRGRMDYANRRNFNILNLEGRWGNFFLSANGGYDHACATYQLGNLHPTDAQQNGYASLIGKYSPLSSFVGEMGLVYTDERGQRTGTFPRYYFAQAPTSPTVDLNTTASFRALENYYYLKGSFGALSLGGGARFLLPLFGQAYHYSFQGNVKYAFSAHQSLRFSLGEYWGHTQPEYEWEYTTAKSTQYALEYAFNAEVVEIHAAGYYKEETSHFAAILGYQTEPLSRHIAGGELSLSKEFGGVKGELSYSYLWGRVDFRDKGYPTANAMPYFLKGLLSYNGAGWGQFALTATAHPGLRYTPIEGGIVTPQQTIPQFGSLHSAQFNDYLRLDFSYSKVWLLSERSLLVGFLSLGNILDAKHQYRAIYSDDYSQHTEWRHLGRRTLYFGVQWMFGR